MTDHDAYNYKFFSGIGYGDHPFVFPDYADQPLSRYPGRLLIVNQRDGAYSRIGELSNHWYPDVLEVSRHYPEALLAHLRAESSPHELLWSRDRVAVYRLASAGNSS